MTNDDRVRFTLRMPTDLYKALCDEAKKRGFTANAMLVDILWSYVSKRDSRSHCSAD